MNAPSQKPIKPLGKRAYGSIPHLPGSRRGPADKGLSEDHARILTHKTRDKHDVIIVQEKLDGSNVSVAKINGVIVPLIRAGYEAATSKWTQHHHFHDWVMRREAVFKEMLVDGERLVGEWLMEAHGTRYSLPHEPFVAFDIMRGSERMYYNDVANQCCYYDIKIPRLIHEGGAFSIEEMLAVLEPSGHGAIDPVEGAVWRCERTDKGVDFLGKYVRPEKQDGKYLAEISGQPTIYNWKP